MKSVLIATLAVLATPLASFAGGMANPVVEPAIVEPAAPLTYAAPTVDWTGVYTGLSLGYGKFQAGGGAADGNLGIAGVDLGYRRDLGNLVLGTELSYSQSDINQSSANTINNSTGLKVLVGTKLGKSLLYGDLGVARANATIGGTTASDNGYFGGVGVDYALNNKWTVGGEVQSSRYNDFNNSGVDLKDTSVQLKVGMRF